MKQTIQRTDFIAPGTGPSASETTATTKSDRVVVSVGDLRGGGDRNRRRGSNVFLLTVLFQAVFTCSGVMGTGSDPYSLGMGNTRAVSGGGSNAAVLNPAILGAQFEPWGGAQLIPLCHSLSAGYWSDKLALTPYKEFFSINEDGKWQRIVTQLINQSFRVAGKTAEETSNRITDRIKGGASIYGGSNIALLSLTLGKIAVDVRTSVDVQTDLPDAPFLILFSGENGLKRGTDLSLTHLGAQARIYTDINFAYGRPVDWSNIAEKINEITRGITDLRYASWGLGLTFTVGHGYLDLKTVDGGIHLNEDGTRLSMNADLNLKTSGIGFKNNWDWDLEARYEEAVLPAGGGGGINAGVFMYGEHTSIGIALRRLGPMIWRDIRQADIPVRTRDISVAEIVEEDFDAFDRDEGGYFPDPDSGDVLHYGPKKFGWQPTRLNFGLGYRFNFRNHEKKAHRALSEYINTSFDYEQSLAPWPGRSFVPRIALGAENAFLWGVVPFRVGFIFGGAEKIASSAGFAVGLRTFCLQVGYEAVGTPYWYPKRGFEVAFGLSTEWRRHRDPDGDGISDKTDSCAYLSEDIDGHEDKDGCPDPDNDGDARPDTLDQCPKTAEDIDGFEDADGCPDYDNDHDSIADTTDQCPLQAEDCDSFMDADGCPDPDNDSDGVADSSDSCRNAAEDRDGVQDADGCPEADSDGDGIADTLDKCPSAPETRNFIDDGDGCPDSVAFFTPAQKTLLNSLLATFGFTSSGKLKKNAGAAIDALASLLGGSAGQRYLLTWCDTALADSVRLLRASTIAAMLAERGLERSRSVVPAAGVSGPCGGGEPANTGALHVTIIKTVEEYEAATKNNPPAGAGETAPINSIKQ